MNVVCFCVMCIHKFIDYKTTVAYLFQTRFQIRILTKFIIYYSGNIVIKNYAICMQNALLPTIYL